MATKIPKSQNVVDHPRNIRHVACITPDSDCPDLIWVTSLLKPMKAYEKNSKKARNPPPSKLPIHLVKFQEH